MAVTVKLDSFEGPLDLLLQLIEKNKVDIFDIPIREITELKHCKELGAYDCRGFDTFGPLKLVGGIAKGHPTEAELRGAVAFYENL